MSASPRLERVPILTYSELPAGAKLIRASAADLNAYGDISRRTFADTYRESHSAEVLTRHIDQRLCDDVLVKELADPARHVWALERDEVWVGYTLLRHGSASVVVPGDQPVEIERFYIAKEWHGRGYADSLMNAALASARTHGARVAWLGVWEQNSRAVRFYTKCGFAVMGRATYMFDGKAEDDLVMSIAL